MIWFVRNRDLISFIVLTPFGRQQLYDLGISTRMKYGFLLQVCSNNLIFFRLSLTASCRTLPNRIRYLFSALSPSLFILPDIWMVAHHTPERHRMLHSALNFAAGFFDFPFDDKYQQSILIEARGVYLSTFSSYHFLIMCLVQQHSITIHDVSIIYISNISFVMSRRQMSECWCTWESRTFDPICKRVGINLSSGCTCSTCTTITRL